MAVFGAARLLNGLLHRLEHLFRLDALLPRDHLGDLQQVGPGGNYGVDGFHRLLSYLPCLAADARCAAASSSSVKTSFALSISPKGSAASPSSVRIRTTAPCGRSEEHTSELRSLMRTSYAVFCLEKKILSDNSHKQ